MTTAIYARISDDRQDGVGVDNQLQVCRAWCDAEGWAPAAEYVDNDVSASVYARKPRKAYKALLRAVEAGEVERIVVFATDRLYRQPRELEHLIPLAEQVEVRSKVGGLIDLSCAGGRLNARMQTALAANESEVKSERIRLSQQGARAKGKPHGGPRPFGWRRLDSANGGATWDPRRHDPKEAALIRQAVDDVLAGATVTSVAKAWNAAGVPLARGGTGWDVTTVASMLRSPRNAGLVGYNGSATPGDWPPIIERAKWERVCAELDHRRARFATSARSPRSLLSGLLVCGKCGTLLTRGRTRKTNLYRCKKGPGASGCGRIQIAADPLEVDVVAALIEYLDTTDLANLEGAGRSTEAAVITRDLQQLEADANETSDLAGEGKIRPADFARFSTGLEARRADLRRRLATLNATTVVEPYAGRPGRLAAAWPKLSDDQRRPLLLAAFGHLTIGSAIGSRYDLGRVQTDHGARFNAPAA